MNAIVSYTAAATSGVWATSSPVAFTSYAVFCVGNNKYREMMFKAWALGEGIGFKELVGAYKGITEASFIVEEKDLQAIIDHGWIVQEESVLLLSPRYREGRMFGDREATLWFPPDGARVNLGRFREATRDYAMKQDAWTFDPSEGTYWVAD